VFLVNGKGFDSLEL